MQLTAPGGTTALSYEGTSGQLAGDGASSYTWTPGGTLTGTAPAASPGTGVLDLTDHHTDLAGQFTATGTTLTGSRAYGPWGATAASGGTLTGALGYQSQYTSPATGQVNMGARWYNPATGSFGNKDTVTNKPVPDSASASPFGYAADNPLDVTDPAGHRPLPDPGTSTASYAKALKAFATQALPAQLAAIQAHIAAVKAAVKSACTVFLTQAGCAGQLRTHSVLAPSPAQRATDYSAYQQVTADTSPKDGTGTTAPGRGSPWLSGSLGGSGKGGGKTTPLCPHLGAACQPLCQSIDINECYNIHYNLDPNYFANATSNPRDSGGRTCSVILVTSTPTLTCTINAAASGDQAGPSDGGGGESDNGGSPPVGGNGSDLAKLAQELLQQQDGASLSLSYMDKWTPAQRALADEKVAALNDAAGRGDLSVTQVDRAPGSAAGRLRRAGVAVPAGWHGDHVIDLQLGGQNVLSNLSPLDGSVNSSLGSQIAAQIRDLPIGTSIVSVRIS